MVEAAVSSGSATFAVFWATLRRDQIASLLARTLDLIVDRTNVRLP